MDPWLWLWPIINLLGIGVLFPTLVDNDHGDALWWVAVVLVVVQVALLVLNLYLLVSALNG